LAHKAFSSEVVTGSRQENASDQESKAPFRETGLYVFGDPCGDRALAAKPALAGGPVLKGKSFR
jgi:hypothetical protein